MEESMKTFKNLIEEVQNTGLCHHCGGCVTFCTAVNYAALELGDDGRPRFSDEEKCIECGLCYSICPEINELEEETKAQVNWTPPVGQVLETTIARAEDHKIVEKATDGGVVTAILLHLFDTGKIDGAIVTRQTGLFKRQPWLATTREEIIDAAGFYFDASHGMSLFSDKYSTFAPSIQMFGSMTQKGLRRVALVGTPCQIKTVRKMESLGIVPSDSIQFHLGLFCSGNFVFGAEQQKKLEERLGFQWENVRKINVKDKLLIHLKNNDIKSIDIDELGFMKRFACRYCPDYSAEYADISFGGIGAREAWTTMLIRTPVGRNIFLEAKEKKLEIFTHQDIPNFSTKAFETVLKASQKKKEQAEKNRKELEG